ncbi:hypothetical protein K1719_042104 [Acacia pycnantha]|nr:hypothetical protein K1719_042104 [Acacia pycnantha]
MSTIAELSEFPKWILAAGDGSVPIEDDTDDLIIILGEFLLQLTTNALECVIDSIYFDLLLHLCDKSYFCDRAILTSTLSIIDEVNNAVLHMLPGEEKIYLSADSVPKQDDTLSSIANMTHLMCETKKGLKILILDEQGKPTSKTYNIVYKEVFYNLLP